jgi:hypothetical protein
MLTTDRPLSRRYTDISTNERPPTVAPRNLPAARLALRLFAAVAVGTLVYRMLGGDSAWPPVAAVALSPLVWLALRSGRSVEVREDGLVRRGMFSSTIVPWHRVRAIRWHRDGGVESYRVQSRFTTIELVSDRPGYSDAARRLCTIARFRNLPIGL